MDVAQRDTNLISVLDLYDGDITKNMEILKDLFYAPPDSVGGSLLPAGINFDTFLPNDDADMSSELLNDPVSAQLPLFGSKQSLVDHNMNDSPRKSQDVKPRISRFGSQGSIDNSDTEIDCSHLSHTSLSEYESMIKSSDCGEDLPQMNAKQVLEATDSMVMAPRCQTPQDPSPSDNGLPDSVQDLSEKLNPVTPTKPLDEVENPDPWTPTANLKMLMSAASPEIRNRERQKLQDLGELTIDSSTEDDPVFLDSSQSFEVQKQPTGKKRKSSKDKSKKKKKESVSDEIVCEDSEMDITQSQTSRKDKSLGLLCHRFLMMFPNYPEPHDNTDICLDEIAKELGVERRRIYDIINVLESVEIVSRVAKNKYVWHGKTNIRHTLAKLQTLAVMEGFVDQIEKIKDLDVTRSGETDSLDSSSSTTREPDHETSTDIADCNFLKNKKDKSLGILSQRFIMLFLVTRPKTVNLDLSAKIIVGDPNIDRTENAKFKTKIRRLYDIANILTSLELIKKVHITEARGRKPAFKYVGPDIEMVGSGCCSNGPHRPSSKHSLLDCIRNPKVCTMLNAHKPQKPNVLKQSDKQNLSQTEAAARVRPPPIAKKSLARHASFEQICEVAELERNRLYFESSHSVPTSPTKAIAPTAKKLSTPLIPLPVGPARVKDEPVKLASAPAKPVTAVSNVKGKKVETIVVKKNDKPVKITTGKNVILKAIRNSSGTLSITEKQLRELVKGLSDKTFSGLGSAGVSVTNKTSSETSIARPTVCKSEALAKKVELPTSAGVMKELPGVANAATQSSPDLSAAQGIQASASVDSKGKDVTESQGRTKVKIIRVCRVSGANTSASGISSPRVQQSSGVKRTLEKDFQGESTNVKKSKLSSSNESQIGGHQVLKNYLEKAPLNAVVKPTEHASQMEQNASRQALLKSEKATEEDPAQVQVMQQQDQSSQLPPNVVFSPAGLPQQDKSQSVSVKGSDKVTESKMPQKLEYIKVLPANLIQHLTAGAANSTKHNTAPTTLSSATSGNKCSDTVKAEKVMTDTASLSTTESTSILSLALLQANISGTTPETRSKSQPSTISQPRFGMSPVMVPGRPVSVEAPPQIVETPPSLAVDPNLVVPQPKILMSSQLPTGGAFMSPLATSLTGNMASAMVFSSSGISPLQHLGDPLMASTSQQLLFPDLNSPGCDILQKTSTPNLPIVRPPGGYQPTSRNIINLVPFLSSPVGKEAAEASSPLNLCQVTGNSGPLVETPAEHSNSSMTIGRNSAAPTSIVNPITVNGKPVATPGCFFRSTPGGLQQVSSFSGHNSAFKVVNRFSVQGSEQPLSTARRLQLTLNDLQHM